MVTNRAGNRDVGTLRWAVSQAHMNDIVRFAPALAGDTIVLDTTLTLPSFMTIEGPRNGGVTISGGKRFLVMRVLWGGVLRNVGIMDGKAHQVGGIHSSGKLTLENSVVWKNSAYFTAGIFGDTITLINTTLTRNEGAAGAGGVSYARHGMLTMINSTISHNAPTRGISPWGTIDFTPKVLLKNSIIARNGNGMSHFNCYDTVGFVYEGTNIADDPSCGFTTGIVVLDPKLNEPANNGGPTLSVSLQPQSAAINAGTNCSVTVDQRYVARDAKCDVGAFEFTGFTTVTLTIDTYVGVANGAATVTGTIRCSRSGDTFGLNVQLQQQQGGKNPMLVNGFGGTGVSCTTTTRPWRATLVPTKGAFEPGNATATAITNDVPNWVTPAKATRLVKLVRDRR